MDNIDKYLYTEYGIMLNGSSYTVSDEEGDFSATRYMLGIRPKFDELLIDPCFPGDWKGFTAVRKWRGATYKIAVQNPDGVMKGVKKMLVDGQEMEHIPVFAAGSEHEVEVIMG